MKDEIGVAIVIILATAVKECTAVGIVGIDPVSERNQHVIKTCGNFYFGPLYKPEQRSKQA